MKLFAVTNRTTKRFSANQNIVGCPSLNANNVVCELSTMGLGKKLTKQLKLVKLGIKFFDFRKYIFSKSKSHQLENEMTKLVNLIVQKKTHMTSNFSEFMLCLQKQRQIQTKTEISLHFLAKNPCRSQYSHYDFFKNLQISYIRTLF